MKLSGNRAIDDIDHKSGQQVVAATGGRRIHLRLCVPDGVNQNLSVENRDALGKMAPAFIRRARGFMPEPIDLGQDGPMVLGVGGYLEATLCVAWGREAFVSQHVGDLGTAATVRFYHETARQMLAVLEVVLSLAACDRHPDYRSTLFAEATGWPLLRVQQMRRISPPSP